MDEISKDVPKFLVEKADESFVWIAGQPKPYIDLIMGFSSTNFGHTNKFLQKSVRDAIRRYGNLPSFHSSERKTLDKKIIASLNIKDKQYLTYYTIGGAKAVDTSIKIIKAVSKKEKIIVFKGSFFGFSYGAMMLTDKEFINKNYYGKLPGPIKSFSFPNNKKASGEKDSRKILANIENYLKRNQSDIAGIIYEPVQGMAGFIEPPATFLELLEAIAKKYGILTVCDEVQTGIGRMGTSFYLNRLSISPDIILLGKSLAGGYFPLSAVIVEEKLYNSLDKNKAAFDSTFSNNNLGIYIADKVMDMLSPDLLEEINKKGQLLESLLKKLESRFSFIEYTSVIGFAGSIKINFKNSLPLSRQITHEIRTEAFKNFLMLQWGGINGDIIKIVPSFYIKPKLLIRAIDILYKSMEEVQKLWDKKI